MKMSYIALKSSVLTNRDLLSLLLLVDSEPDFVLHITDKSRIINNAERYIDNVDMYNEDPKSTNCYKLYWQYGKSFIKKVMGNKIHVNDVFDSIYIDYVQKINVVYVVDIIDEYEKLQKIFVDFIKATAERLWNLNKPFYNAVTKAYNDRVINHESGRLMVVCNNFDLHAYNAMLRVLGVFKHVWYIIYKFNRQYYVKSLCGAPFMIEGSVDNLVNGKKLVLMLLSKIE